MEEKREFIKLHFNKEPNDLEISDIESFIDQEPPESKNLEFKRPEVVDGQFDKITKTISGFANTEGGLLIIGISERPNPLPHHANIADQIVWYEGRTRVESLEHKIRARITPLITDLAILPITSPTNSTQSIFLIDVPQSKSKPHYDDLNQNYFIRLNWETISMPPWIIELAFQRSYHPDLSLKFDITQKDRDGTFFKAELHVFLQNTGNASAEGVFITLSYNTNVAERPMRIIIKGRPTPLFLIRKRGMHGVKYADIEIPLDSLNITSIEDSKMLAINCQQLPMHPHLKLLIARLEVTIPAVLASGNDFKISYTISAKDAKIKKGTLVLSLNDTNIEIKE